MDALIAIALLCQVNGDVLHHVKKHQDKCQLELIECYEKSLTEHKDWWGPLKDCRKAQLKSGDK